MDQKQIILVTVISIVLGIPSLLAINMMMQNPGNSNFHSSMILPPPNDQLTNKSATQPANQIGGKRRSRRIVYSRRQRRHKTRK